MAIDDRWYAVTLADKQLGRNVYTLHLVQAPGSVEACHRTLDAVEKRYQSLGLRADLADVRVCASERMSCSDEEFDQLLAGEKMEQG